MNFKCQVVINHPKGSTVPKVFDSLIREGQLYDPIGSHTIKLREYYHCLNEYLHGNKESIIKALMQPKPKPPHTIQDSKPTPGPKKAGPKKGKKKGGQRARKGRKRKAAAKKEPPNKKKRVVEPKPPAKEEPPTKLDFPIPEFPKKYPFSETLKAAPEDKCKMIIKYKGEMSKSQVKEKRMLFIKNIFIQEGCCVEETETDKILLEYLSDILHDFLQKFVRDLGYNRLCYPFKGEEDLWGPLETTLRNFGMGGITALNNYYYEVAKKHDILLNKCMDLYAEFKNSEDKSSQKKELPTDKDVVDVKKCQTSMSTDKDSK